MEIVGDSAIIFCGHLFRNCAMTGVRCYAGRHCPRAQMIVAAVAANKPAVPGAPNILIGRTAVATGPHFYVPPDLAASRPAAPG